MARYPHKDKRLGRKVKHDTGGNIGDRKNADGLISKAERADLIGDPEDVLTSITEAAHAIHERLQQMDFRQEELGTQLEETLHSLSSINETISNLQERLEKRTRDELNINLQADEPQQQD